jgi:hypothetical protein
MARDMQELAAELGRRDAAEMQAHVARRRRWQMAAGVRGTVAARLDGDRWLADCPFCAGAELVTGNQRGQGMVTDVPFFCMSCGMTANDRHPMAVVYPAGGE